MQDMEETLIDGNFEYRDPVVALDRVLSSGYSARIKVALIFVLEGAAYRFAAHRAGLRSSRAKDVHRAAVRLGIDQLHLDRKAERDAARYSKRDWAAIEAVLEDPQAASMKQLIRATKASTKRVEMLERR